MNTNTENKSGRLIDVKPLGTSLANSKHGLLLETKGLKIKRMVLAKGQELSEHKAPGEITVQCLEGRIEFSCHGKTEELQPGQMIYLSAGELHSVRAVEDSSFLLTIVRSTQAAN